jgi:hypothetical protein
MHLRRPVPPRNPPRSLSRTEWAPKRRPASRKSGASLVCRVCVKSALLIGSRNLPRRRVSCVFSKAGEPQTDGQQHASFRSPAPGTLRDRANGSSFLVHDGVIHIHNDDVKIHAMFAFFSVFFVIHSHDRLGGRLQGVQANWGGRGRGGFAGTGKKSAAVSPVKGRKFAHGR